MQCGESGRQRRQAARYTAPRPHAAYRTTRGTCPHALSRPRRRPSASVPRPCSALACQARCARAVRGKKKQNWTGRTMYAAFGGGCAWRRTRARSARRAGARGELPCDGSLLIAHRGGAGGSLVAAEASEWSGGPGQPHDSHPAPASGARADVAQRALASAGQRQLYRSVHLPGRQPGASVPPTGAPVAPSGKSGAQPRAGHAWRGAGGCLDDRSARSCAFAYSLCLHPRVC